MQNCKNCSSPYTGNYCPQCGQKYIDYRYNLKDSIAWAFNSIFNMDKGFLFTSWALLLRPGKVVSEFLDGITIKYAHPFRIIFIWATISAIIGVWAGTFEDTGIALNEAIGVDTKSLENTKKTMGLMKQYMSFIILGMVPFYAFATSLLFKSKKLNYAEHLIVNSYALSSSIMVGIPLTFLYAYLSHVSFISYINFALGAIIISRVYAQVFQEKWYKVFFKYILAFLITFVSFLIVTVIITILYSLIVKFLGFENAFMPAK